TASGKVRLSFEGKGQEVRSLAVSPDGKRLAVGGAAGKDKEEGAVTILDVATGKAIAQLGGHAKAVSAVAFSPAGKVIAAVGGGGTVRLWDAATGKAVGSFNTGAGGGALALSPDGKVVAAAAGKTVQLWDPSTDKPTVELRGHGGDVTAVAFSPD